jgi:cold-inducible RNA-binding protein
MNLFVAGLPYDVDNAELEEIFEKFGPVRSAKVAMDKETGKSRGFGFVDMQNEEDGKQAIDFLNGIQLGRNAKALAVKAADDRSSSGPAGNKSAGGYKGGGRGGFEKRW